VVHQPHNWTQNSFDDPNQPTFAGAYSDKDTQRDDIGLVSSGVKRRREWLDLNQNDLSQLWK
jgi:hypothetical protein